MASSAGQQLVAGRIPGELIAYEEIVADSSTFTSEAEIASIDVPVIDGRTYSVWASIGLECDATGGLQARLREDTAAGTNLDSSEVFIDRVSTTAKYPAILFSLYEADATETKTFVITGVVLSGGGTGRLEAASTRRSYILVRYEFG